MSQQGVQKCFQVLECQVTGQYTHDHENGLRGQPQARLKVLVNDKHEEATAQGVGLINALDTALRKILVPHFPFLENVVIHHYIVNKAGSERSSASSAIISMHFRSFNDYRVFKHTSSDVVLSTLNVLIQGFQHEIAKAKQLVSA